MTSNWVAIPLLVIAGISLALLYLKGRSTEALIGAVVLVVAAYLILLGGGDDGGGRDDRT
ncbi:MAG: hypothetical protein HY913_16045 [Desulfomonile tiedjei]|nr:hypothetical protein [Desulfomonile tiedjei]